MGRRGGKIRQVVTPIRFEVDEAPREAMSIARVGGVSLNEQAGKAGEGVKHAVPTTSTTIEIAPAVLITRLQS